MAQYTNVGAWVHNERPKTKKALREAMRNEPINVKFDLTSMFDSGGFQGNMIRGNDIPDGVILSVVGPDPYNRRSWYATITSDGKVK